MESRKSTLEKINKLKEAIERAEFEYKRAEREGDFAKASEIKYGTLAKLAKDLEQQQEAFKTLSTGLIKQEVDES